MAGGVPTEVDDDTPQFVKDYHDFYQTKQFSLLIDQTAHLMGNLLCLFPQSKAILCDGYNQQALILRFAIAFKVAKALALPPSLQPFTVVPFGYPAKKNPQQDRYDEGRIHYVK